MSCFLLTWNPDNWPSSEFDEYVSNHKDIEYLPWSCGNRKKNIVYGDTVYLLKQGKQGRGIIGHGIAISEPYIDAHFNATLAAKNETCNFIKVKFDHLTSSTKTIPFGYSELLDKGISEK